MVTDLGKQIDDWDTPPRPAPRVAAEDLLRPRGHPLEPAVAVVLAASQLASLSASSSTADRPTDRRAHAHARRPLPVRHRRGRDRRPRPAAHDALRPAAPRRRPRRRGAAGAATACGRQQHLAHAQEIVAELMVSLDSRTRWDGGEQLMSIYRYLLTELIGASVARRRRPRRGVPRPRRSRCADAWHEAAADELARAASAGRPTVPAATHRRRDGRRAPRRRLTWPPPRVGAPTAGTPPGRRRSTSSSSTSRSAEAQLRDAHLASVGEVARAAAWQPPPRPRARCRPRSQVRAQALLDRQLDAARRTAEAVAAQPPPASPRARALQGRARRRRRRAGATSTRDGRDARATERVKPRSGRRKSSHTPAPAADGDSEHGSLAQQATDRPTSSPRR